MDESREGIKRGIGLLIKQRREGIGATQDVLARSLGVSRTTIGNIEAGRHSPSILSLYRIASALHVSPRELLPPLESTSLLETKLKLHGLTSETATSLAQILIGEKTND